MQKKIEKKSKQNFKNDVILKNITEKDYKFLYILLEERNPLANISHRKMPTYKEHVSFVKSKPYSKWHIIEYKNKKVGSVYLSKQDEIGLFLKKEFHDKGIGSLVLQKIIEKNPRPRYLANVAPKNKQSTNFFKKNGFILIQHTYEYNVSFGK